MQHNDLTGNIKEKLFARRALTGSILATAIFMLAFLFLPYIVAKASASSQEVSVGANWVATSLTFDPDYGNGNLSDPGHGDVTFGEIVPTSVSENNYGTMRVIKKQIGVTSNGKYYSVYLSMAGESNDLKLDGTASNIRIPAVGGSWDEPVNFSNGTGWGFAVPGTEIETSASTWDDPETPEYPTFSQNTTFSNAANLGTDLTYASNSLIYNKDTWVAVPALSAPQQIWRATTDNPYGFGGENGDLENNNFSVYYGIMIGPDVLAGTYENEIVYTALASAKSLDEVSENLLVATRFVGEGTTETLQFDVSMSTAGLIKPNQVFAYVVPAEDAALGIDTLKENIENYEECAFNKTDTSTDIVFSDAGTTITCSMPAKTPAGDASTGDVNGLFDIWVTIPSYGANYISKTTRQGSEIRVPSVIYAGLQSKDENGDPYITEMQEMTGTFCKNTNMWGTGLGNDAIIYNHEGEKKVDNIITGNALLAAGIDEDEISSFFLVDNRDSKTYKIRRLADGNCWMVQNLSLDLEAAAMGAIMLDDTNTDLHSKSDWTPDESITSGFAGNPTSARFYDNGLIYVESATVIDTDMMYKSDHASMYVGNYYNWYAAVAETETYVAGRPSDTICPHGWSMPELTGDRSYENIILSTYSIPKDQITEPTSVSLITQLPLSFTYSGQQVQYDDNASGRTYGRGGYYTIARRSGEAAKYEFWFRVLPEPASSLLTNGTVAITGGGVIRCVLRDE
ncbi:hypothetical protein IJ380_01930 [Candidatus Saccharibacteria bacterium]|nr:hypothetical protein [Candidatus Saccharibacteria bacterium]